TRTQKRYDSSPSTGSRSTASRSRCSSTRRSHATSCSSSSPASRPNRSRPKRWASSARSGPTRGGSLHRMTPGAPEWPLRTERLDLRPYRETDLEVFHAMRSDPEVVRYLSEDPLTLDESRERLAARLGLRALAAENDWLPAAIV